MTKVAGSYRAGHDTRRATLIMVDYRAPTGEPSAQLLFDAMNTQLKKNKVAEADLATAHVELPVCTCS